MKRYIMFLIAAVFVSACASIPKDTAGVPSYAPDFDPSTRIGKAVAMGEQRHPGDSGYYIIPSDMNAFIARAVLIDGADKSLDLQYYIVSNDLCVDFLMERLISAADRGVRVRLLFDYVGTGLNDSQLWLLNAHPNIEVRLFNPKGNLRTLNHRMHNKAFIVDNAVGIVGGRNLADEYFGASKDSNFADMDIVAAGPVVKDISKSFDLYWNCRWAVPYETLSPRKPGGEELKKGLQTLKTTNRNAQNSEYALKLKTSDFLSRFLNGDIPYSWSKGYVVYDLPEKITEKESMGSNTNLMTKLMPLAKDTKSELILISPYFVPNSTIIDLIGILRGNGIKVRITTNSLASTDVVSVHSGYAKYRKALLEKGVELYEMRADPGTKARENRSKAMGSYKGSLHAKVYIYDRNAIFVGSRNLDSRSRDINTEIGLYVDSPEIAAQAAGLYDLTTRPEYCFILSLDKKSHLVWTTEENGEEVKYTHDPMAGFWRRFEAGFLSVFVPESQL